MYAGMVLFAIGFMLLSQVEAIWTFYIAFMLIAIGASLSSFLSLVVAVVHWFRQRRTMALGLLSLGFAVGGFAATPMALIIEGVGWRTAAFFSGLAVLVLGIPLARVVRHRPEDHGLLPDGAQSRASLADDPEDDEDDEFGMGVREALHTPAFWLISLGQASALLVIGALMVHLVVYINDDLGFSLGLAAFAITVQTIGQVIGQLAGAYLGDRWPKRPMIVAALLGHSLAIFVLAMAATLPMVYLAVAINGTAWGLRAPLQMAIRADYFGRRSFGTIMGFSSLVIMSGMIVGPTFSGVMYDQTGSYQTSFLVLAVFAALGAVLFAFARPPAASLVPREPAVAPIAPALATSEARGTAAAAGPGVASTTPRAEQERRAG
jgi:MFS family permease